MICYYLILLIDLPPGSQKILVHALPNAGSTNAHFLTRADLIPSSTFLTNEVGGGRCTLSGRYWWRYRIGKFQPKSLASVSAPPHGSQLALYGQTSYFSPGFCKLEARLTSPVRAPPPSFLHDLHTIYCNPISTDVR